MMDDYLGILPESDPLHGFLADEVVGRLFGFDNVHPVFDVYKMNYRDTAFCYVDRRTRVRLVAKFYGSRWLPSNDNHEFRVELARREFNNMVELRALGLTAYPHLVVRPLALSDSINQVLVEEFAPGCGLDDYILEGILQGRCDQLRDRLADAACFLADMHDRSQTSQPVSDADSLDYLCAVIRQLVDYRIIAKDQCERLEHLRDQWAVSKILGGGRQVRIHGDPMPVHFRFSREHDIALVDLEWVAHGDRAADLGCIAAELKHLFWFHAGNVWASEPFIKHFYAAYKDYTSTGSTDFASLTNRSRFFMGFFELRTSTNFWLDLGYRHRLIQEAEACLHI